MYFLSLVSLVSLVSLANLVSLVSLEIAHGVGVYSIIALFDFANFFKFESF